MSPRLICRSEEHEWKKEHQRLRVDEMTTKIVDQIRTTGRSVNSSSTASFKA